MGKDHFTYKLNPTRRKINFPEQFGKSTQKRHLNHDLSIDETGTLKDLVENSPAPLNAEKRALRAQIAKARKFLANNKL